MNIKKCEDCGYKKVSSIDGNERCKYCRGLMRVVYEEVKKPKDSPLIKDMKKHGWKVKEIN